MFGEACMFALTAEWGMSENKEHSKDFGAELILTPLLKENESQNL